MEAAELGDHVVARPEVQVVCVAEQDRRPEAAQVGRVERLHRPLRPDRHERGRRHVAVGGVEDACASGTVGRCDLERHRRTGRS
jgi:hypothetical protein